MRPVLANKGGQGPYQFNLATNLANFNFTFKGDNAKAANKLFGTNSPTYLQCLNNWTTTAKIGANQIAKVVKTFRDQTTVQGATEGQIGDVYRGAADDLATNLGNFCSYCENILDKVEVEHICPKSQFPLFCLAWENFLLSCSFCNGRSAKGSKPSRDYVVTQFLNNAQPPNETGYYNSIRQEYIWADSWQSAYRDLKPRLEYLDPNSGTWKVLNMALAVKLGSVQTASNKTARTVQASIWLKATDIATTSRSVKVTVDGPYQQSDNIVDLCQLNNLKAQKQDKRVWSRTLLWFTAMAQLSALSQLNNQQLFDTFWVLALKAAAAGGFYSVWVLILEETQAKDPSNQLLVTRFVNETKNVPAYFPGTDDTQVP